MSDSVERWIVLGVILINSYCLGANCVERFVNYATWRYIPGRVFRAYHLAQGPLIRGFIVVPAAAAITLQIALLFFYERLGISGTVVWSMVISSMAGVMSTVLIQIPIHRHLDVGGYSPE